VGAPRRNYESSDCRRGINTIDKLGRHSAWEGVMRSAYGRQTPPPDHELTCVEPGSPMGELFATLLAAGLHLG
jgi:hypothetical protein